ncbi:hypothetical protein JCM11641_005277, partial [Rhodosporidiobolus odoratus]
TGSGLDEASEAQTVNTPSLYSHRRLYRYPDQPKPLFTGFLQSSPHTSSLAGTSPYLSVPPPQQSSLRLAIPNMPRAAPLSPGSAALSPRAQAVRNAAHARLVASGSGTESNAPPVMRATRVFSQDTDPTTVK